MRLLPIVRATSSACCSPFWQHIRPKKAMQYEDQTVYRLIGFDVGGVDLDADALPDQVDRENEARVRPLSNKASYDTLEGAVRHFDHHPFVDHRAGVVLQLTFKEPSNAVDLMIGDRRGLSFNRYDIDNACAL